MRRKILWGFELKPVDGEVGSKDHRRDVVSVLNGDRVPSGRLAPQLELALSRPVGPCGGVEAVPREDVMRRQLSPHGVGAPPDDHRLGLDGGGIKLHPGGRIVALAEVEALVADGATFRVWAPHARAVHVVGEFNGWSRDADPMAPSADGIWSTERELPAGRHTYQFAVDGDIVVCERAIRDEGTSYHYLPGAKYATASPKLTAVLCAAMRNRGIPFRMGTSWTTDAPYRETVEELRLYRAEGVATVEMEAAALFAVGAFRGVSVSSVFAVSDRLSEEGWHQEYHGEEKTEALRLVFEVARQTLASECGTECKPRHLEADFRSMSLEDKRVIPEVGA